MFVAHRFFVLRRLVASPLLLRRLSCCVASLVASPLTLHNPEFDLSPLSSPRGPPPQAPQWLLPSASRLPQVRACRCCLDGGNARGAAAPGRRRSISLGSSFFFALLSCSLLASLSGSNFALRRAKVDSLLFPSARPPQRRSAAPSTPHGVAHVFFLPRTRAEKSRGGAEKSNRGAFHESLIIALACRPFSFSFFSPSSPAITLQQKKKTGARVAVGARRSTARPRVAPIVAASAPAYVPDMDKRVSRSFKR